MRARSLASSNRPSLNACPPSRRPVRSCANGRRRRAFSEEPGAHHRGGEMLFRADGEDAIAIAQPSHAWLSGQLARAWGNERFAAPAPYEEVCLGAEQHDIG